MISEIDCHILSFFAVRLMYAAVDEQRIKCMTIRTIIIAK